MTPEQQRERDLFVLAELDAVLVDDTSSFGGEDTITEREQEAFADMRKSMRTFPVLTDKQRAWVLQVASRVGINPVPPHLRPPVPRGAEVELAPVLGHLPKKPPTRRHGS